jgi:hypothetical protein
MGHSSEFRQVLPEFGVDSTARNDYHCMIPKGERTPIRFTLLHSIGTRGYIKGEVIPPCSDIFFSLLGAFLQDGQRSR